jgi:hypothetical protein
MGLQQQQQQVNDLEIEKHWYNFMMWGRCAYQPCDDVHGLGTQFWQSELRSRFPELAHAAGGGAVAGAILYSGWANASEIVPQVNRLVIGKWCDDAKMVPLRLLNFQVHVGEQTVICQDRLGTGQM